MTNKHTPTDSELRAASAAFDKAGDIAMAEFNKATATTRAEYKKAIAIAKEAREKAWAGKEVDTHRHFQGITRAIEYLKRSRDELLTDEVTTSASLTSSGHDAIDDALSNILDAIDKLHIFEGRV